VLTDSNPNTTVVQPINGTLTIGSNITVRGIAGRVGNPGQPLVNLGTIMAASSGGVITLTGSSVENRGTIGAQDGGALNPINLQNNGVILVRNGTLNLTGTFTRGALGTLNRSGGTVNLIGILDNTGKTLSLDATTGSWQLAGTIVGGTVNGSDGAQLIVPGNSAATLDGLTLNADFVVNFNAKVRVLDGLTLNSLAIVNGGLNFTELNFDGTQTLAGTGQIVFTDSNPVTTRVQPVNGTLTIGPNMTIRGLSGTVGNPTFPLINQGTISADVSGGTIVIQGNPFTNNGTTQESNGGKIAVIP
jgi:hypothetical protein